MAIILLILSFEVGAYYSQNRYKKKLNTTFDIYQKSILSMENQLGLQNHEISDLTSDLQSTLNDNRKLDQNVSTLKERIELLEKNKTARFPFTVPTKGIVGTYNGTFGGNMHGIRHLGIDIWTTTQNNGSLKSHIGNPVYSACNGKVGKITAENGAVTIKCDPIPKFFAVPEHEVYTHYSHMGHAETKQLYITVATGQRVHSGELIGYQGDLSSFFPEMRNVHLHFSVFSGLSETDPKGGAYNPCLYIGGDCSRAGVKFASRL